MSSYERDWGCPRGFIAALRSRDWVLFNGDESAGYECIPGSRADKPEWAGKPGGWSGFAGGREAVTLPFDYDAFHRGRRDD
jgi:hypothetical protein